MRKGILQKQYPFPVRRYVQTMSLRDNPELIALYRKAHSQPEFWPEIGEGSAPWASWRWNSISSARDWS